MLSFKAPPIPVRISHKALLQSQGAASSTFLDDACPALNSVNEWGLDRKDAKVTWNAHTEGGR